VVAELYGPDVRRDFYYALVKGWAKLTGTGRVLVTAAGRKEWEAELLEAYG
jgi:hypothetical protein